MNLSIRMRVSIAASVVLAAGLVGCQTTLDYVDHRFPQLNLPRPSMPSFDEMVPFNRSRPRTQAEPYQPPKLEAVPDAQEPLILPAPAASNSQSRRKSRPVSAPPALPPYEADTSPPSVGLFPSGPVRKIKFETSTVIRDSNIIQTGCCALIVQSCCPPPCCPTPCCPPPCCETSCCSTGCGMSSLLGKITHPYYAAKYRFQNVKDRLRCKLSSLGACCNPCFAPCAPVCNPCVSSCDPCSNCVTNGYVAGGIVNQYPVRSGCSTCSTGVNMVPQTPVQYSTIPQQPWRQPAQQNYALQQRTLPQPQYQRATPAYQQPQIAVRQPVVQPQYQPTYRPTPVQQPFQQPFQQPMPQQRVAQPYQYQPQPAQQLPAQPRVAQPQPGNQNAHAPVVQPQQDYTSPQPVQPATPTEPTADIAKPEPAPQTSNLTPGHSPLGNLSPGTRSARVYRATRFQ